MFFTKKQLENYADVLIFALNHSRRRQNFKPYDIILIRYHIPASPLAEALHRKCLERKWNVLLRPVVSPAMERDFYEIADTRQLKFKPPGDKEFFSRLNGYFAISAPENLTHLKSADASKLGIRALAGKSVRDIMDKREDKGFFGWNLSIFPSKALLKASQLTEKEYTQQIIKACYLNDKNPIKKWKEIFFSNTDLRNWLNSLKIDTLHIQSKSVDLKIKLGEKRVFKSPDGKNIPSFEIFTSPDWRYTEGVFYSNLPDYNRGNLIKGVKLVFKKGLVVEVSANQGEKFVKKFIKTDIGASQLGEFSLTDRRFSLIDKFMANTLYDENHGGKYGNCHIALGKSFSDTFAGRRLTKETKKKLGFNESAIHWDIVNTEDKQVKARLKNGQFLTIYEKGKFNH